MAYFPNGTSFMCFVNEQCAECLNYRDNGTGSFGCAISDAHFLLAHKMHGKKGGRTTVFATLDHFIPNETGECKMRLTREGLEEAERKEREQADRERYEAAMAEARAA